MRQGDARRVPLIVAAALGLAVGSVPQLAPAEEPELPAGLRPESEEPELPAGLGLPSVEPALPPQPEAPEAAAPAAVLAFELTGFVEARGGARLREDANERDASLAEARLQLEAEKHLPGVSLRARVDLLTDALADRHDIDLETGDGLLDLREANAVFSPTGFTDAKLGRQILTWGTGDLVFINDLFPKDWNSFLLGRDEEYLKAPSDSLKLSAFSDWANLDLVYTPRFDADRYIDGRRVSFFDSTRARIVGRDAIVEVDRPGEWFADDEWALRIYRNFGAYEGALYGYDGFWKSPAGLDAASGRATFPRLSVVGASVRGPLGKGIANAELGYYVSRDDRDGGDPFVRNSEFRLLLGYEQEIARDLTLGVQYYLERMLDHDAYIRSLPVGVSARDENRHLLTARLRWLTMSQNLEWSLFAFVSPSDADAYLRPGVAYKVSDTTSVEVGANVFLGRDDHTFFAQFERNTNLYLAARYGF
jgi:hypothetical protein